MKRIGLGVFSIGVLASVGLVTQQGFAQAIAPGVPKCSLRTLKGLYLFGGGTATIFPPAFGVQQESVGAAAGIHVFNGDGTGKDYVTFTLNGVNQNVPSPTNFTYTMNDNCTGTYAVGPPGPNAVGPTFDIFIAPDGSQITGINTDQGSAGSYFPTTRVWPARQSGQGQQ
jgi:hypothetical protein